ncbi:hypothetical protein PHYSODRAFT_254669 [Phytophthora sojae]|uniref:Uncharacterized protein n=1 Tax=Phytophthora sojae (strain P6497) TaxID=1094619 RepID=G5A4F1_PHYSP|nr:hypothetical protein PHYSODRAFT_254669 [Phytophthora sojae]EGZ09552.1 hypothetical protein PHYSODRAFT_254669 [Phytophthora sojae]|eukprot:XP_009534413.1 hypothetical protein PHYSODRAFT_254669 [Phytophthora sojae]
MLRAPRPRPCFSNAQVSAYFFTPCSGEYDEPVPDYFRCGTLQKQTRRNGFTNLMQHVRQEHPGFEAEMRSATTAETGSLIHYARRTSVNRFGWLEWVVKANLPLVFCENPLARRYTSLDPISVETLKALMEAVAQSVGLDIAAELLDRFWLMLDGWSYASVYCVAVFIYYEINGVAQYALLSMAPIIQEPDDDLSARTHRDFLAGLLDGFGKTLSGCVFLVADNCSVNRCLAVIMQVPLVGCASHRLNRAVQCHLEQYEDDLAVVQALMLTLRTLKQSAKLR